MSLQNSSYCTTELTDAVAICTAATRSDSNVNLKAMYGGDDNYEPSESSPILVTIIPNPFDGIYTNLNDDLTLPEDPGDQYRADNTITITGDEFTGTLVIRNISQGSSSTYQMSGSVNQQAGTLSGTLTGGWALHGDLFTESDGVRVIEWSFVNLDNQPALLRDHGAVLWGLLNRDNEI